MKELEMLYEGKSKQIFKTDNDNYVVIRFKDDTAAFYNIKRAIIEQKGRLTCDSKRENCRYKFLNLH